MMSAFFLRINRLPYLICTRSYNVKAHQTMKRGSTLSKMVENKDKKKHWQYEILSNNIKSRNVFEKIHNPTKRQNVLNSLFIKNITDVLSTEDVAPEILNYHIEITGVKISSCCKVLNVYWQIPPSKFKSHEEIATILNLKAPRLRAELISRNVMGRVPQIFFLRDLTNAYHAAFEEALRIADFGSQEEKTMVVDDAFTKNIFSFRELKDVSDKYKKTTESPVGTARVSTLPERPPDMKSDVFGLKHDLLEQRIVAQKVKVQQPRTSTNVVATGEDIFSKIPGSTLHEHLNRDQLLKQFQVQRKMLAKGETVRESGEEDVVHREYVHEEEETNRIDNENFIEEETCER